MKPRRGTAVKNFSLRRKKVSSLLREALGPIVIEEIQGRTGGIVSVTRVEVPADLLQARVYVSCYGVPDPTAALALLENLSGQIRRRLASSVKLKYNPALIFRLDPGAAAVERIDDLLDASNKDHGRGH
ncbi:MAG: 30S ribosome-binding factor RbfA [Candidatus Aminicenantes bacterium]|nr:30S ribosome-binding factor RbfA [Candidatus Aminicenantes bacterium]